MSELPVDRYYSFENWCSLPNELRTELYDGKVSLMSMPSPAHQMLSLRLTLQVGSMLAGKSCQFFHAPIGVKLFSDRDIVVSPDALIICDKSKIGEKVIQGAPDLAVEILSTVSANYDNTEKLYLYLKAGVHEYWIISLESKMVLAYTLKNNEYVLRIYSLNAGDVEIRSGVLPELIVNLQDLFGG